MDCSVEGAGLPESEVKIDPACGKKVDPVRAAAYVLYETADYSFCSKGCASKFKPDSKRWLAPQAAPALVQPGVDAPGQATRKQCSSQAEYVCPMDPPPVN